MPAFPRSGGQSYGLIWGAIAVSMLEHIRLVARGTLGPAGTKLESWSCGLNFVPEGGLTVTSWPSVLAGYANDAFDDWAAFVTDGSGGRVSDFVSLDEVRGYRIHTDGKAHDDVGVSTRTPVRGVANSGYMPASTSLCVTLDAGRPKLGRFGRIYLPPQCYELDGATLGVKGTHHAAMFTAVQSLLSNLSNIPGVDAGWRIAVASGVGSGSLRPVTEVRLGKVPDHVQRRRRSLKEAYATAAFAG